MAGSNGSSVGGATAAGGTNGTVIVESAGGIAVIGAGTELKGLNYFDGKFLRAQDLKSEQSFLRFAAALVAQGGGPGVVHGFDVTDADGGSVLLKQGLAFDGRGRPLYLTVDRRIDLGALIKASQEVAPSASAADLHVMRPKGSAFGECVMATAPGAVATTPGSDLWLLTIGFAEALCGEEDVFGKLCQDACVDAKNRRYVLDGVVVRARPLEGLPAFPSSQAVALGARHHRSRVASAYFEAERRRARSAISGAGIQDGVFCLGAPHQGADELPIAVFARSGDVTTFVDAWISRRERIEPPNRRYWAGRMSMRPWDVFLAQVLQFQCQLKQALSGRIVGVWADLCAAKTEAIGQAHELVSRLEAWHASLAEKLSPEAMKRLPEQPFKVADLSKMKEALGAAGTPTRGDGARILIDGGIVELPPAGYLPVSKGSPTVNQQVRDLMGPGVDLRFRTCRADHVPHLLEEAQHLERISLLDGLDDPASRPAVDVFVPDGRAVPVPDTPSRYFDAALISSLVQQLYKVQFVAMDRKAKEASSTRFARAMNDFAQTEPPPPQLPMIGGAARWAPYGDGGRQLYWAGAFRETTTPIRFEEGQLRVARAAAAHVSPIAPAATAPAASTAPASGSVAASPATSSATSSAASEGAAASATTADAAERASVWLEATMDRDPFSDGATAATGLHLRMIGFTPGARMEMDLTLALRADLSFTPSGTVVKAGGEAVVSGVLAGSVSMTKRPAPTAPVNQQVSIPITLRRSVSAAVCRITVEVKLSTGTFEPYWQWSPGAALTGELHLATTPTGGTSRDFRIGAAVEDPDAKNHSNAFHALSDLAIPAIAEAVAAAPFNEPDFKDHAEQALFPGPQESAAADVNSTRDWVLFTRRRERPYGDIVPFIPTAPAAPVVPAATPLADERFSVWWADLNPGGGSLPVPEFLEKLSSAATESIDWVKKRARRIGFVSYPDGESTLRDAAAALADASSELGNGLLLRLGRIGRQPPQDPPSLERARLEAYLAAVGGFVTRPSNADFAALQMVPPALAEEGASGAILIGTCTASQEEVLVFRVWPRDEEAFQARVQAVLKQDDSIMVLVVAPPGETPLATFVGVARFRPGESVLQPDSDDLAARWGSLGGGGVHHTEPLFDASLLHAQRDMIEPRFEKIRSLIDPHAGSSHSTHGLQHQDWTLTSGMNPAYGRARVAVFLVAR